jgi:hypothetical protein
LNNYEILEELSMIKKAAVILLAVSFAASAFAQDTNTSNMQNRTPRRSQFSEYVMRGWSTGLQYASMNAEAQVTFTSGGTNYTANAKTDESTSGLGVSVNYNNMRRNDWGVTGGMSLIKKLEENGSKDTSSLANGGALMQLRPEMNIGYAFAPGIFLLGGGHVSYLDGSVGSLQRLGFGLQLGVGYVPARNIGLDLAYYSSSHSYQRTEGLNEQLSNLILKQVQARISYLF